MPSRDGGVEVVVQRLAENMRDLGHEVTLFNRRRKNADFRPLQGVITESVFTINRRSLDAIVYAFFATLKARRLIKKRLVDVVHYHAEGPCFFLGLLPKKEKRKGVKLVVTVHGLDWQRGKWGSFASKIIRSGEKAAVKYADEIIVLSEIAVDYFSEKYGRDTVFIPNGTDLPVMLPPREITEKFGVSKGDYVLYLGRIVPEKRVDMLISAWKRAKKATGTDKKLIIAGGASHTREYSEKVIRAAESAEGVKTIGAVEGDTLSELYSNAYLYVLPSDVEGMPMSLLEALSYGNVCLVSDIPENVQVVQKDGYTFKVGDESDLTEKLKYLLTEDLKSHKKMIIRHTWKEITQKTLELYRKDY